MLARKRRHELMEKDLLCAVLFRGKKKVFTLYKLQRKFLEISSLCGC